jgi:hypothetical protein
MPDPLPNPPPAARDNPFAGMRVRQNESGVWIAEDDGSGGGHLLGLVASAGPLPHAPTVIVPFAPKIRDGMGAYVTDAELGLNPLSRDEVVAVLGRMPSEVTVVCLAVLLSRVAQGRTDASVHLALAGELFGDAEVMGRLGAWCATPGHVIFSEQGLFGLLAQAVIHCRQDASAEFTAEEWLIFKRLVLASTSLLHDDPDEGGFGDYSADRPEPALAYMTQNLLFNATSNFGSVLARTWRMFGELARDPSRRWKTSVDVDVLLSEIGLTLEQQLALAFSLYAGLGMDAGRVALLPSLWRSACERVDRDRDPDDIIKHISMTPEEMRAELTGEQAQRFDPDLRWASVPFIERPFLRLSDDRLLLVSPRGIEGWPTDGLHYRLLRAARVQDRRSGVQKFTAFAGELTEVSTIEMLEDAHTRAAEQYLGAGRVLPARGLRKGGESTDAFVRDAADVVVIEISSSRITAETRVTGDVVALQRDLEKVVVKRIRQLDRTISALRNDEFDDMPNAEIARIFPVVLNVEPMRWTPMLHAYLLREAPGLLQQAGVQPLQFIEIEDMEALMSVVGPRSLPSLLDQKIREAGIDADILQWFLDSSLAPRPDRPPIVTERLDRQFEAMIRSLGFDPALLDRWKAERHH